MLSVLSKMKETKLKLFKGWKDYKPSPPPSPNRERVHKKRKRGPLYNILTGPTKHKGTVMFFRGFDPRGRVKSPKNWGKYIVHLTYSTVPKKWDYLDFSTNHLLYSNKFFRQSRRIKFLIKIIYDTKWWITKITITVAT